MSFFQHLQQATAEEARGLYSVPQIIDALEGRIGREVYIDYLTQAYHHVRHTVPLMQAAKARLDSRHSFYRDALDAYIEEETGHEAWILDDIAAAGGDRESARLSKPRPETEAMVAYAYDQVRHHNPMSFFGMVYVLEGTSIALASRGAEAVQKSLGLPPAAFRYLTSHGALDIEHMSFFENLMQSVDEPTDQAAIIAMGKRIFFLFADVFRAIPNAMEIAHEA